MSVSTLSEFIEQEPRLGKLMELLRALPRYSSDKTTWKGRCNDPRVKEAEDHYHTFNREYQFKRVEKDADGFTVRDEKGKPKVTILRKKLILELHKHPEWQNFRKLVEHSEEGRERRSRWNAKYRERTEGNDPRKWYLTVLAKRKKRAQDWWIKERPEYEMVVRDYVRTQVKHFFSLSPQAQKDMINQTCARYQFTTEEFYYHLLTEYHVLSAMQERLGLKDGENHYWERLVYNILLDLHCCSPDNKGIKATLEWLVEVRMDYDKFMQDLEKAKLIKRSKPPLEEDLEDDQEPIEIEDEGSEEELSVWEEMGLVS